MGGGASSEASPTKGKIGLNVVISGSETLVSLKDIASHLHLYQNQDTGMYMILVDDDIKQVRLRDYWVEVNLVPSQQAYFDSLGLDKKISSSISDTKASFRGDDDGGGNAPSSSIYNSQPKPTSVDSPSVDSQSKSTYSSLSSYSYKDGSKAADFDLQLAGSDGVSITYKNISTIAARNGFNLIGTDMKAFYFVCRSCAETKLFDVDTFQKKDLEFHAGTCVRRATLKAKLATLDKSMDRVSTYTIFVPFLCTHISFCNLFILTFLFF